MIGIIIQARLGSNRLPQKMVLPFYECKSIFELLVRRMLEYGFNVPIILATSNNPLDDKLVNLARNLNIEVFRGSEYDVLGRFINAAERFNLTKLIRICADNPFLDLDSLDFQIKEFTKLDFDYWCYAKSDGTPTIKTHFGFWSEAVKLSALKSIKEYTDEWIYFEHVTNYIYTHEKLYKINKYYIPEQLDNLPIRLTIDTKVDFELARSIYAVAIKNRINIKSKEIGALVVKNKPWMEIMRNEILSNLK